MHPLKRHCLGRMKPIHILTLTMSAALPSACEKPANMTSDARAAAEDGGATSFAQDLAFLRAHTDIHVLKDEATGAQVAVAPAWQGRVMTSSATGEKGASLGWIHRGNVKTGILPPAERNGLARHIHIFGGEERFWLGPEGGQYALFFPPAPQPYTFENWFTPALIDTEPFEVVSSSASRIDFNKEASIINRKGTDLRLGISRSVEILERPAIAALVKSSIPDGTEVVAYRSTNTLTNRGPEAWTREDGLVSIWLLGMFPHGPDVTMVIPLKDGPGKAVNADYFGPLESDRLLSNEKAVFFKGDGAFRSKIGVPPGRSTGIAGSYDAGRGRLTIVHCEVPPNAAELPYVRSQWEDHKNPYAGDLINAYNDGPPAPGEAPLGPFYELETSSPALPLEPGQSMTHVQTTMHFQGDAKSLNPIAQAMLGVSLEEIVTSFPKS
jgi:hypothetical protein